jgi:preprotein translocase subunit SecG
MQPFIIALHVVLCLFMILIILLQPAKGDMGAAFGGGGSGAMFGPRGPTSILQRATTVVAVMFMGTSITLALYSNPKILDDSTLGVENEEIQRMLQEQKEREEAGNAPVAPEAPEN